jgi:hypothetical protein
LKKRAVQTLLNQLEARGEILTPTTFGRGNEPTYLVTVGLNEALISCILTSHSRLEARGITADVTHARALATGVCERMEAREKMQSPAPFKRGQKVQNPAPFDEIKGAKSCAKRCKTLREKVQNPARNDGEIYKGSRARFEPSGTVNEPSSTADAVRETLPKTDPATDSKNSYREELQAAILEACGKTTDWQMGTVSPKFRMGIGQLLAKLVRDKRTARDVQIVRARLPAFLGRDPTHFTPPSPGQLLDLFDAVLNFDPDQTSKNQSHLHGTYSSNPAGGRAAKRGEQTGAYFDELGKRRADIEERKRKLSLARRS